MKYLLQRTSWGNPECAYMLPININENDINFCPHPSNYVRGGTRNVCESNFYWTFAQISRYFFLWNDNTDNGYKIIPVENPLK